MKKIWLAILLVVGFVSTYPFDFRMTALEAATVRDFLSTCCDMTSRGDIFGNVILFLPVGFAGMLALSSNWTTAKRLAIVFLASVVYALVLQVLQIYLPSRDQSLQDVLWNSLGTLLGASLARLSSAFSQRYTEAARDSALVPTVLIGAWLAYRLIPFVPSLDWQLWKDSVKPLINLDLSLANVTHDLAAWALTGYLLCNLRKNAGLDRWLPLLGIGVLGLEVSIVDNSVSASNLFGLLFGVMLWNGLLRRTPRPEPWLLATLVLAVMLHGLTPIVFRSVPADFSWLPFEGFLGGSMYINSKSALEKLFLYAGLIYLCHQLSLSFFLAAAFSVSMVAFIEVAQTRLAGHTPEITDPILVVLAALGMRTVERSASTPMQTLPQAPPAPRTAPRHHVAVRLRSEQFAFLETLGAEAGISPAEAAAQVIDYMIEERLRTDASETAADRAGGLLRVDRSTGRSPAPGTRRTRWITIEIPVSESQLQLLAPLASELNISLSRLTRRLVAGFIASLG